MIEFKTISYDIVQVGEEFKSDDLLIKPEDVETFALDRKSTRLNSSH